MYKIAVSGKANTGKNTVSRLLYKELCKVELEKYVNSGLSKADSINYAKCKYIAFADPIKKMAKSMFPDLPTKYLTGSSKYRLKEIPNAFKDGKPLTVRQLLIDIGTGLGRSYNENIWLDVFDFEFNKAIDSEFSFVIVTDVRFRNEFDHLKKKEFFQIRLLRSDHTIINHSSETNQETISDNEFDYMLHNNGSMKDLEEEVKKIVSLLK